MEAIILIGIQGSGKSTFYRQRFFDTHVRINLDMLRTRRRERALLHACLAAGQRFVVDNTNPTRRERAVYIQAARAAHFRVSAYYFPADVEAAAARNAARPARQVVPMRGLMATLKRLQPPAWDEGFDELHEVRIDAAGDFVVRPM